MKFFPHVPFRIRKQGKLCCVGLLLWLGYYVAGIYLAETGLVTRFNTLMDGDYPRVISDMTLSEGGFHYRTRVHPLFVLFFNPLGSWMRSNDRFFQSWLAAWWQPNGVSASLALTAAAGSAILLLVYNILRFHQVSPPYALGAVALLSITTSHVLFTISPETYVFGALGFALLIWISSAWTSSIITFVCFGLTSVFCFGMTVTNGFHVGLWTLYAVRARHPMWRRLLLAGILGILVLLTSVVLASLQKARYPSSRLFYEGTVMSEEGGYMIIPGSAAASLQRFKVVIVSGYISNVIAIDSAFHPGSHTDVRMYGANSSGYNMPSLKTVSFLALAVGAIWCAGSFFCILCGIFLPSPRRLLIRAVSLALFGELCLHYFYGGTILLYSTHWTLYQIIATAFGFDSLRKVLSKSARKQLNLIAAFTLLCATFLNARFFINLFPFSDANLK